jgi:CubicO group peptidase (beta-lactamase class C family)
MYSLKSKQDASLGHQHSPRRRGKWQLFILMPLLLGWFVTMLSGSWQMNQSLRANAPVEDFQAHLEERIPSLMKIHRIPGCSVALIHQHEIVWTKGFGWADVEGGRYLTADTPMSVQSITKSLTAWGVLKLAEKGSIDLNAPLSRYLRDWQFPPSEYPLEKVTIHSLLTHTSGLPLGDFTDVYPPGEVMPSLRTKLSQEAVLLSDPGKRFSYSNVGYHLLELLIEEVTGMSYADYMHLEVFLPLGMQTATFEVHRAMTPYPPCGYDLRGRLVPVYVYPQKASGGLFATAEDVARFAAATMLENSLLHVPQVHGLGIYGLVFDSYGYGHYIETLPNGLRSVSHGGQGNGIMTHFQTVPETGDGIVILTNSQRSWPFIAYVLRDWAQWCSFPTVGMERIIWGHHALSGVIGMLLSASLFMAVRMVRKPERHQGKMRFVRFGVSFLLLGILSWCARQKYLFLSSVFPALSVWLGVAVLVFSLILLLSGVLGLQDRKGKLSM